VPWLGYFDLIDQVDKFVFLDDVKLEKCSWHVRNKIKTLQGEQYLTIPTKTPKGRLHTLINEAQIDNKTNWRTKHLRTISYAYKSAKFFTEVFAFIKNLISYETENLSDFNIKFIGEIIGRLAIDTELFVSSQLKNSSGVKDRRLVAICKELNCNYYLSPQGSSVYIERDSPGGEFSKSDIQLYYHVYEHPVYNQLHGHFIPFMSIVDLLFNHGFEESLNIIRSGRRDSVNYLSFGSRQEKEKKQDLKKDIQLQGAILINFVNLTNKEKELVRTWRNIENIRKWMYQDHIISWEEHLEFMKKLEDDNSNFYWLVRNKKNKNIGVVSLTRVDFKNKNSYFGIYSDLYQNTSMDNYLLIESIKELAFDKIGLLNLRLEVMSNNERAINFYKKAGFIEEARLKDFVFKDGLWIDVIVMGIHK